MNNLRNNIQLIGNLGKDVEMKELPSGKSFAKVTIATNDYYKNAQGEKKTDTQWHNLIAWGQTAQNMQVFLKKGKQVCINGKLQHRQYEDDNGQTKYISEIVVKEFVLMN